MGKRLWVPKPEEKLPYGVTWEKGGFMVSVPTSYGLIRKRKKTKAGALLLQKILLSQIPKLPKECMVASQEAAVPETLPSSMRKVGDVYRVSGHCKFGHVRFHDVHTYAAAARKLSLMLELDHIHVEGDIHFEDEDEMERFTTGVNKSANGRHAKRTVEKSVEKHTEKRKEEPAVVDDDVEEVIDDAEEEIDKEVAELVIPHKDELMSLALQSIREACDQVLCMCDAVMETLN